MTVKEVVVIGGGPAGYVAAIRAAQLGAGVTLVEEKKLGGVCLNCGCMPTKFLLHGAEIYHSLETAEEYGISAPRLNIDMAKLQAGKNRLVSGLVSGLKGLLEANKIEIINGRAKLAPSNRVEIDTGQGESRAILAGKIILATGARAAGLPIPGADSPDILNYQKLLDLDYIPGSLIIIGGGVVGVEMATIFSRLGSRVTIVEMMPNLVPTQDTEVASILENALREDGIQIYCQARVERIDEGQNGKVVTFSTGEEVTTLEAEAVAVTTGQRPNIEGLGLEECGLATENGRIKVDERMQTSIPDIYAAGDVTGGIMLAHVGFAEGKVAAENASGQNSIIDYQVVPQCIFTSPELAGVGLSEEEALAQGYEIETGRFPFRASGMAAVLGETRGLVKIITERKYSRILGVHIIGPRATTLIAEAALAIKLELTPQEIVETIHAHPTLSEAFWEAALDVTGQTIHYPSGNKRA